jgi:hypothetical protein
VYSDSAITINHGKEKKMKKHTITFQLMVLAIGLIGLVYSSSARVQNRIKRTVSEMHFHPDSTKRPVEFSSLKIRGKSYKFSSMFEKGNRTLQKPLMPGMEFEDDDDFWEHLFFDVTNVSEKTIVYLRIAINLYSQDAVQQMADKNRYHEAFTQKRDVAIMVIEDGDPSNLDPPYLWSLKPGESTIITIDPEMRDYVRPQVLRFSSPIIRIGVHASTIVFADGSSWSASGRVNPPQPKNKQSSLNSPAGKESNSLTASRVDQVSSCCPAVELICPPNDSALHQGSGPQNIYVGGQKFFHKTFEHHSPQRRGDRGDSAERKRRKAS